MAILELLRSDGERVRIDSDKQAVFFDGKEAYFTDMEWVVLKGLYFKIGQLSERNYLLSLLPNKEHKDDTRIIDVHVSSIRKKMEKLKLARIKSVYGKGYVLSPSKKK